MGVTHPYINKLFSAHYIIWKLFLDIKTLKETSTTTFPSFFLFFPLLTFHY